MKILVYGVHHWNSLPPSNQDKEFVKEWMDRLNAFVPHDELFIATGNYSDINFSPAPKNIPVIQNGVVFTTEYSPWQNYFRNGFITGIWHALLNIRDWDVLIHIQPRVLIGVNLRSILEKFINSPYNVIAPKLSGASGTGLEISFFGMKRSAAIKYITGGERPTFFPITKANTDLVYPITCEQEAYNLFHEEWFDPWPEVITTRQFDSTHTSTINKYHIQPFTITKLEEFCMLPVISTGKHSEQHFIDQWKLKHPIY